MAQPDWKLEKEKKAAKRRLGVREEGWRVGRGQ